MTGIRAELVTDEEGLAALEPEWLDLWRRSPDSLPFQAPGWLIPWWRQFRPGTLFVLAGREAGRLVGLAPGYIEGGPLSRRILPLGISLSDHLDVLVDPCCGDAALRALADAAAAHGEAWDVWELEELPPGAAALRLPVPPGCSERLEPQSACPVLPLPERAADIPAVLPPSKRRSIRLAENRCARLGGARFVRAEGGEALEALEQLFSLHRKRWQIRGEEGILSAGLVQDFHREALPRMEQLGLLRLYRIFIGGAVAAVYYGLNHRRIAYFYLTGFDSDYEFASPGMLSVAHAMKEAIAEGCRHMDFLRGREPYKYEWGAVDRWNVKRSIFRAADG